MLFDALDFIAIASAGQSQSHGQDQSHGQSHGPSWQVRVSWYEDKNNNKKCATYVKLKLTHFKFGTHTVP